MTTQTLHLPSHPIYATLHPLYLCHQTQCISYTAPTLWMTTHTIYIWYCIQYALPNMNPLWHHTPICMISHPLYLWHHIQYILYHSYCFHDNTTTIPDISPTIFDIRATVPMSWHPLYRWHHNKYLSHHTWHTYDLIHIYMKSHWKFMISMLSIYDITTTAFMTSCLLYMKSHPRFMTSHPL